LGSSSPRSGHLQVAPPSWFCNAFPHSVIPTGVAGYFFRAAFRRAGHEAEGPWQDETSYLTRWDLPQPIQQNPVEQREIVCFRCSVLFAFVIEPAQNSDNPTLVDFRKTLKVGFRQVLVATGRKDFEEWNLTSAWARAVDEFIHSPVEVSSALLAIAGALSPAFKAGHRFWTNIWARLRSRPIVPTETLRMVQDVHSSFWGLGNVAGEPAMQVVLDGHVTDISGNPNRILRAEIPKPLTHADMAILSNNHDARRPQILDPHECAEIRVCFFIRPVVGEKGKPWKTPVILSINTEIVIG
jgi:hypothetical protein